MPIYRIQTDGPDAEGSIATVFFADPTGGIALPGITVAVSMTDTLADIVARAEATKTNNGG